MISSRILNPVGRSRSRFTAVLRNAKSPLSGSLAIASRRGNAALSRVVAQDETSTRRPVSSPSAEAPFPAYRVPITRSQS